MKPQALIFPNEINFRRDIRTGQITAVILRQNDSYHAGDSIILIPKNSEPWEDKGYKTTITGVRNVKISDLTSEEIRKCGCNGADGLLGYYRRFFDDDLKMESEITLVMWHRVKEADLKENGYSVRNFGNQQSSAPR